MCTSKSASVRGGKEAEEMTSVGRASSTSDSSPKRPARSSTSPSPSADPPALTDVHTFPGMKRPQASLRSALPLADQRHLTLQQKERRSVGSVLFSLSPVETCRSRACGGETRPGLSIDPRATILSAVSPARGSSRARLAGRRGKKRPRGSQTPARVGKPPTSRA